MATDPNASQVAKDRELLDRLGYGVLDIQTGSGVGFEDVRRYGYVVEPELSPKATAKRLQKVLGRPFTEKEARVAWDEILQYKQKRTSETGEDIPIDQVIKEWDDKYGFAFRRRWFLTRPEPDNRKVIPGARERRAGKVGKAASVAMPELRPLLDSGFSVHDVLTVAKKKPLRALRFLLRRVPKGQRNKYYVALVARLTGWTLSEEEAERVWAEVLKHKVYLSQQAGADVPIERAVVDYFKRLRLSGLDRAALWETGHAFAPNAEGPVQDTKDAPSTEPGALFPA